MPFKSEKQSKACFATGGFGDKVDCEEWAHKTDYKHLPKKKKGFREWLEIRESEIAKDVEKAREKPGGSNVGKKRKTSGAKEGPFCGPSGGAPKGSYPVTSPGQAAAAKSYAHNAPNPEGIKKCADRYE